MLWCIFSALRLMTITGSIYGSPFENGGVRIGAGSVNSGRSSIELRVDEETGSNQNGEAHGKAGHAIYNSALDLYGHFAYGDVESISEILFSKEERGRRARLKRESAKPITTGDLGNVSSLLPVKNPRDYFVITTLLVGLDVNVSALAFYEDIEKRLLILLQKAANTSFTGKAISSTSESQNRKARLLRQVKNVSFALLDNATADSAGVTFLQERNLGGFTTESAANAPARITYLVSAAESRVLGILLNTSERSAWNSFTDDAMATTTESALTSELLAEPNEEHYISSVQNTASDHEALPLAADTEFPLSQRNISRAVQPGIPFNVRVVIVTRLKSNTSARKRRQSSTSASRVAVVYYALQGNDVVAPAALVALMEAKITAATASVILGYPVDSLIQPYPAASGGGSFLLAIDTCWIVATVFAILTLVLFLTICVVCCKKRDEDKKRRKREALGQPFNVKSVMEKDRLMLENMELKRQLKAAEDAINQLRTASQQRGASPSGITGTPGRFASETHFIKSAVGPTRRQSADSATPLHALTDSPVSNQILPNSKNEKAAAVNESTTPLLKRGVTVEASQGKPQGVSSPNIPTIVVAPSEQQGNRSAPSLPPSGLLSSSPSSGQAKHPRWDQLNARSTPAARPTTQPPNPAEALLAKKFRSIGVDCSVEKKNAGANTTRFDLTLPQSPEVMHEFEKEPLFAHVARTYEEHDIDIVLTPSELELAVEEYGTKGKSEATQTAIGQEPMEAEPNYSTEWKLTPKISSPTGYKPSDLPRAVLPSPMLSFDRGHCDGTNADRPGTSLADPREIDLARARAAAKSFLGEALPALRALGLDVVSQKPDFSTGNPSYISSVNTSSEQGSLHWRPPVGVSNLRDQSPVRAAPLAVPPSLPVFQHGKSAKELQLLAEQWISPLQKPLSEVQPNFSSWIESKPETDNTRVSRNIKDDLKVMYGQTVFASPLRQEMQTMFRQGFTVPTIARIYALPPEEVQKFLIDAYAGGAKIDAHRLIGQMNATMEHVVAVRNYLTHHRAERLEEVKEHLPRRLELNDSVVRLSIAMMLNDAI